MPAFFSVVMATWNRADRLSRAIDSVLAQSDDDWELIIVDDGSTDATAAMVTPYRRERRLVWLPRSHEGVWPAKNAGAAEARGRWITFLDSDDAYTPEHLAARRRCLAANPEARFVHGGVTVLGPEPMRWVPDAIDPTRMVPLADCAIGATFVVESRFWSVLGGFTPNRWAADADLLARAMSIEPSCVVRCDEPTYLYVRTPGEGVCEEQRLQAVKPPWPAS
ncbi:MAG: glycosyltransferase family A protein [Candidatus Eisenbacteria bacterium]|nr:glycosyltransferase family A protein [Candidatus Eisenbacteria bacterium]